MKIRQLAIVLVPIATLSLVSVSPNNFLAFAQSPSGMQRRISNAKSRANDAVDITEVRNLQDSDWLERLEVEVKNLSNKPVYYVQVLITLPDVKSTELDGVSRTVVIPFAYGRRSLLKEERATSNDTPIKPGASYVFTIPRANRQGLQDRLASGIVPASAVLRVFIGVYALGFGDGTGFYAGGVPFPES